MAKDKQVEMEWFCIFILKRKLHEAAVKEWMIEKRGIAIDCSFMLEYFKSINLPKKSSKLMIREFFAKKDPQIIILYPIRS